MNLFLSMRQWSYPKEFRIKDFNWSPEKLSERDLEQLDQYLLNPAQSFDNLPVDLIKDIGTNLWRLKKKLVQPDSGQPPEEMRAAYRHVEALWDALAQADVQIRDHTGEQVPERGIYGLKVLAYQPKPNITHKQVQETIKPSIYLKNRMIQMGEVIVSKPEGDTENDQNND